MKPTGTRKAKRLRLAFLIFILIDKFLLQGLTISLLRSSGNRLF